MSQKSVPSQTVEQHVREIRRRTRKQYSSEEKVRIVLSGLRGEHSIAELCRREGIAESMYYAWSKDFLEAGKKLLSGDTERQATSAGKSPREESPHRRKRPQPILIRSAVRALKGPPNEWPKAQADETAPRAIF
jgi:transposase